MPKFTGEGDFIAEGDYLKYMPKFKREGDFTTKENLEAFYSYGENINIE